MSADLREQVDALGSAISSLAHRRAGRLVAIGVSRPSSLPEELLRDLMDQRLSAAGLDLVDVGIRAEEGPIRLLSVEFER